MAENRETVYIRRYPTTFGSVTKNGDFSDSMMAHMTDGLTRMWILIAMASTFANTFAATWLDRKGTLIDGQRREFKELPFYRKFFMMGQKGPLVDGTWVSKVEGDPLSILGDFIFDCREKEVFGSKESDFVDG